MLQLAFYIQLFRLAFIAVAIKPAPPCFCQLRGFNNFFDKKMSFGDHQGEANNGKVGHQKFMIDPNTSPHPLFLVKAMKLSFVVNLIKLVKSDS